MKPRIYFAVTFIFALFICLAFQTLPVLKVNEVQAQDLPPMLTYDWDAENDKAFPDTTVSGDPDGYVYRTIVCKLNLIVNADDVNELLEGTGYTVFPPSPPDVNEAKIEVDWNYRLFSQWPPYTSPTNETIGNVSIGVLTKNEEGRLRYLILADVASPASAVVQANSTVGGGWAEVSREGRLNMAFLSETKRNGEPTLKFIGKVREPTSGLNVGVYANLPEEQAPKRLVKNFAIPPLGLRVLFMDLSELPEGEGRPFRAWGQKEEYVFDEFTPDFRLIVRIPGKKLRLPGGHVLPIIRTPKFLSLRRNGENYFKFDATE